MQSITANELKTKGIGVIESSVSETGEAIISVRGKNRYVVLDIEEYEKYREYELEVALQQTKADIAAGHYQAESVEQHMKRMDDDS
ncbi:type II toxin-antitoxin system prevent-host-death family antitoxin [Bacterioplanoides sp. SCSIO 12839]|uniref:type II toxin-antitoxin system prevent-host-death family antitoxin n=1 Tax=Bacterioplanoides sp. SCSIO 12839 TaxID=2829569 RepID=UPI002103560E|nr:type II toxin-antitoxin system prevent-host-death family antitoxin [Bacterioplanoides sp. SCSIO 12839]UTW48302.1 type II toxin-antitoxin system prevent-host-death family antitoxin [Bacterioplanoides sp. SCSIO 12839]